MAKKRSKKGKTNWGTIAMYGVGALGAFAAGKYLYDAYMKPKPEPKPMVFVGPKVLAKADGDNGTQPGMVDLIKFLNLENIRSSDAVAQGDGTYQTTPVNPARSPLYAQEITDIEGQDLAAADAAKARLVFNSDVESRLEKALGIKTIATDSAIAIYNYASSESNGQLPNHADVIAYWIGDKAKFSAGAHPS